MTENEPILTTCPGCRTTWQLLAVDGALSVAERAKQYGSGKGRSNRDCVLQ